MYGSPFHTKHYFHLLSAFTHEDIGGYEGLITKYFNATASLRANASHNGSDLCGEVPDNAMHLLRDPTSGHDLQTLGMTNNSRVSLQY